MEERLKRMDEKLDKIDAKVSALQVSVEHRVTKLEVKSTVWGALAGVLSSVGIHWLGNRQ